MFSVRRPFEYTAAVVLMLHFFGCATPVAPSPWKTFRYPELGFSIELPVDPKVRKNVVAIGNAACPTTNLTAVREPSQVDTLVIAVTDCSDGNISAATLNNTAALRRLAGGIAGTVGGFIKSDTEYVLDGVSGRQYVGEQPVKGFRLKSFAFVSGKRVYLVFAIGNSPDLDREMKSFTFRVT